MHTKTLFDLVAETSQTKVAAALGVNVSQINRIVHGTASVSEAMHSAALLAWPDEYDMDGTMRESMRLRGVPPFGSAPSTAEAPDAA